MNLNIVIPEGKIVIGSINTILENLIAVKDKENIEFVYGKGKRKSKLQRFVELLEDFVEKQTKYDDYNNIFDGRNSFSKTDHDATFMHMKEDHMQNGQLKPGYNIQIGVEGEYIVGVDVSSERSDQLTLIPFLDRLESNIGFKYNSVTADAGYESGENYTYLENNNQTAYIKPQTYEKSKTIKFKKDISKRENMIYNKDEDYYICAAGKKISVIGNRNKKSKSGFNSITTVYECEDCSGCQYKSKCSKAKGNKQLYVSKDFIRQRENSLTNITTPEGKILRMNRSIQVEGAFGVIKEDYGFRRFLMRWKKNIRIEFLLISFAYNINKLYNKTLQNRNGQLLHLKEVS